MRAIRSDRAGEPGTSIGEWIGKIVGFIVLIVAVSVLYANSLKTALANYAANETMFGPTVQALVPLLLGVAILFVGLEIFMPGTLGKAGRKVKGYF